MTWDDRGPCWDDVGEVARALAAITTANLDDERTARMATPLIAELAALHKVLTEDEEAAPEDELDVDPAKDLFSCNDLAAPTYGHCDETGDLRVFLGSVSVHPDVAAGIADAILDKVRLCRVAEQKAAE